ncbi:MAG: sodium:proton antiporter, partial [Oscillospiraceae bacterium]|nr:sodium:proton antiporter [Oscillospiraceae bacterium]
LAVDGTLLHIVNHASVKLILFPAAGVIYCTAHTYDLNKLRGFGKDKPLLMLVMGIPMASLAGVPGLNGYVSKTLLHESIVEYIHLVPETAALFTAVEWAFLFAGGLTAAYMLKLFVCLFVQSPDEGAHWHTPYASKLSMGTLTCFVAVMPVLGMLPNRIMDGLAAMGRGFMHGHAPDHAVHYFAWINLKGALISLCIGAAVYLLVIRPLLTESDCSGVRYPDRWPEKLNLETAIYRPLICVILPFIGAVIARAGETLVDGTVCLLSSLLYYGQSRNVCPNEDEKFGAYDTMPKPRVGFRYSFAYSIIMMGVGLSVVLLYVLVMG